MSCHDLPQVRAVLDDYLAGELAADVRAAFDRYVAGCADCLHYLHGYLTAGETLRAALCEDDDVPDDVPPELVDAIVATVTVSAGDRHWRLGDREDI